MTCTTKSKKLLHLKDDFGNSGTIEQVMILPYNGASAKEPAYKLTLQADYDEEPFVYHVSVYDCIGDAIEELKKFSCGTFHMIKRIEENGL